MASRLWLVIDGNFVAWRAAHSTGELSYKGTGTGVVFGFLRAVKSLCEDFGTNQVIFAFDHGKNKRKVIDPLYKASRTRKRESNPEEKERYAEVCRQVEMLKADVLPRLGYKNVLYADGYEADDVMARIAHALPQGLKLILVSADKDLYQLIDPDINVYNPTHKKLFTEKAFKTEYGIPSHQWAFVKAVAGCGSDEIPGLEGVGEKTAAAFFADGCSPAKRLKICDWQETERHEMNLRLVHLPLKGCPKFKVRKCVGPSRKAWDEVTKDLGFKSMHSQKGFM